MIRSRLAVIVLAACMTIPLAACADSGETVFVQPISSVSTGGIGAVDKFVGMVVSEHVTEIKKDDDKSVANLFVKEGDDVKKGQKLFEYDTDELQLSYDKLELELEQLKASIESYEEQLKKLETEQNWYGGNTRLQYTIQIQSTQIELKEAQLNLKTKEKAVETAKELLSNSVVTSPVAGRIQSISEKNAEYEENKNAYITIQESGAYRVKGILNELQRGALEAGESVSIQSRTNSEQVWTGKVSLVDYENPVQNNNQNNYGNISDTMTTSSKYPFYVELDDNTGLLLGQHVYISAADTENKEGLFLDESFIVQADDGSAYVWVDNGKGRLEKRAVELGTYRDLLCAYQIRSGLTGMEYIAFPDTELCRAGIPTTKTAQTMQSGQDDSETVGGTQ